MVLSKLLEKVTVRKLFQTLYGRMVVTHEVEVSSVAYDSRAVQRGAMFVAVRGTGADGHRFVQDAIAKGAKVVVLEDDAAIDDSFCMHTGTVKVVVPDTRRALAAIAASWYGHPGDRMTLVGITGTNGKTTTASLVHGMLTKKSGSAGLIGTIEYRIGEKVFPSTHTTPGPLELNGLLARMLGEGCASAAMEVSSHALDQRRVDGLKFNAAVFTNLTRDHLDYHGTMESYFDAKASLFTGLAAEAAAVVNTGDEWGRKLAGISAGRVLTYAVDAPADLTASNVSLSTTGSRFTMEHAGWRADVVTALVGRFNVENALAAAGTGLSLGMTFDEVAAEAATFRPVRGRFEPMTAPGGWTVIVDYAHTPDALEKTLLAIRDAFPEGTRNRIITVFGCGGNRDTAKRPAMGRIAATLSDVTIVTSDNPRDEDPEHIIDEIVAGIPAGRNYQREPDRAAAISAAVAMARKADVVLIAGKGHENYQIVGKERRPFSDREVVEAAMRGNA